MDSLLYLTKMADPVNSTLVTNEDVAQFVDAINKDLVSVTWV